MVDLETSQSIRGHRFPNFEMLDAKIASSLRKIMQNSNFKNRVDLAERKTQVDDRFLRGRQIALMIYECFWVRSTREAILEYSDSLYMALTLYDRRALSSAIMCRPIKAHAFNVSAETQGQNPTNSMRTIGFFFKRKRRAHRAVPIFWEIPMRGCCAQTHTGCDYELA